MIGIALGMVATTTVAVAGWIDREVDGRGRLPSLDSVVGAAEAQLGLSDAEQERRWVDRARDRAWIPAVDARVGTDRSLDVRDATTTSWVRTGEGFGAQLRLRWTLADALFNDGVLRAEKAVRDRGTARWQARDRVVKLYFDLLDLEVRMLTRPTRGAAVRSARLHGRLRAVTGGRVRFGTRSTNPWPRSER